MYRFKMKIIFFNILCALLLIAKNVADSSNQKKTIHAFVKNLINQKPNYDQTIKLGKPFRLDMNESLDFESLEIEHSLDYNVANTTTLKSKYTERLNKRNPYTELQYDFHRQISISQMIDPSSLEIKGKYHATGKNETTQTVVDFTILQSDGVVTYNELFNGTNKIDLTYKDEEITFGKSNKHQLLFVYYGFGLIIDNAKNTTISKMKNSSSFFSQKINDFKHVFPFLSDNSPKGKQRDTFSINDSITQRWSTIDITLPYVEIQGLNDFNQTKIIATDNTSRVCFNLTLITNPLDGFFIWQFGKKNEFLNGSINFTIDKLVLKVNTEFEKNWIVNEVNVEPGLITIQQEQSSSPDINVFLNDILCKNLQKLITTHLEKLIEEEYSPGSTAQHKPTKFIDMFDELVEGYNFSINSSSWTTKPNSSTPDIMNFRQTPDKQKLFELLNKSKTLQNISTSTAPSLSNPTPCVDKRWWFQKPFISKKCANIILPIANNESSQIPQNQTNLTLETSGRNICVDTRWWFQKPFMRNKCTVKIAPAINKSIDLPVEQTPRNQDNATMQNIQMKCSDTRWWFQKPFIRNKCEKKLEAMNEPRTESAALKLQSEIEPTTQKPATRKCVDMRLWFLKPFLSNKCNMEHNITTSNTSTETPIQPVNENKYNTVLVVNNENKCVDTRWWFQKIFTKNKCNPDGNIDVTKYTSGSQINHENRVENSYTLVQ